MAASWQRVREIFERALDWAPAERAELLAHACGGDEELRLAVLSLLDAHSRSGEFMDQPAIPPTNARTFRFTNADQLPTGILPRGSAIDEKYEIDSVIGSGGMGSVYRALHVPLERPVALKIIRTDLLAADSAFQRFRREAVTVARLRHKNIVTVYDYGVAEGIGAYIVMEMLEGQSLREELKAKGRLSSDETLGLMRQICSAVTAAHKAGVVHRDLKPENIFLEQTAVDRLVKVLDFGIAKLGSALDSDSGALTHDGVVLGTPGYISPEQWRGDEIDARSDVYALGCILYELLSGRMPFRGPTVAAMMYQHVMETPDPPSKFAPDISAALDDIVLRAMAKWPDERPQSADDLLTLLHLSTTPIATQVGMRVDGDTLGGGQATMAVPRADRDRRTPTNLPEPITRFVGRDRQIGELRSWLAQARLVTLVGPGGIGKTRLAVEAAGRVLSEFSGGVWLAELSSLRDENLVGGTVASAMKIKQQPGRKIEDVIAEEIGTRSVLLVLDNCEHIVNACAQLVMGLLARSPKLKVLATSREALSVGGEAVWTVPPLELPGEGSADGELSEAARLFMDRAAFRKPGFEAKGTSAIAIEQICRLLEGLPLAIELAAARVRVLPVETICERLEQNFALLSGGGRTLEPRQQALEATLDWSYDLLEEDEQVLFRRLGVFSGGWTLEAAEAIAGTSELETLDLLSRLVDKSLVSVRDLDIGTRYRMLRMVRAYANAKRARAEENESTSQAHAEYYLDQAEAAHKALAEGPSLKALELLGAEHDNIRVALEWFHQHEPIACLELAVAVNEYRVVKGHLAEARRWLDTALSGAEDAPLFLRVQALTQSISCAIVQGDIVHARASCEVADRLTAGSGDVNSTAIAAVVKGTIEEMESNLPLARECFERGLAGAIEAGNERLASDAANGLGEVARQLGDWEEAIKCYKHSMAYYRRIASEHGLCILLCNLGAASCEAGAIDEADRSYEEALEIATSLGSKDLRSLCLDGKAAIAAIRGEWVTAAQLAGSSQDLLDASGATPSPVDGAFRDKYRALIREKLGSDFDDAFDEGRMTRQ